MNILLFVVFLLGHTLLFLGGFRLGVILFPGTSWLQKLGNKLLAQKEKQLNTNPLLKRFAQAVENGALSQATVIIALLIFIKSLGMTLIGFIGLSVLAVPVQGLMMAAIQKQMENRGLSTHGLFRIMTWQLGSMLILTAFGNLMGWIKWIEKSTTGLVGENLYLLITSILLALALAILAARSEVTFFQKNKRLLA